ncbi:alpha/beta hydrolase [Marinobacter profundi]|uniref:Alpha/beta hydrolase n=1 Tax=Marinobacter profundi TaxID=2666256 RepID=A0A2G1UMJ0_9GAMM|nr:alpha/beta hydrolase [Marinobacter profundi]PHQ15665.1 alpha/beta hydrolase [Marinobacter profundi]
MAGRIARLLLTRCAIRYRLQGALVVLSTLLASCSSVFFYPDNVTYITPDRLNLSYQDIYLDTADGETLHGWWLPAQGPEGNAKGTIYFLHGNAQNISSHILNVAWLPPEGYNVFTIDYRGYGKSSGATDIEGALHDVETGLRWLARRPARGDTPLIILGQSLGGALAIPLVREWTLRDEQPPVEALALDGTFSGFRNIAREKLGLFWLTWPLQAPLSWTIPAEYEGSELIADISPVPVLVIHSARDGIIPFHHGQALYEAAGQPKAFLQTDTPHAATFVIPAYKEALLDFLRNATN